MRDFRVRYTVKTGNGNGFPMWASFRENINGLFIRYSTGWVPVTGSRKVWYDGLKDTPDYLLREGN